MCRHNRILQPKRISKDLDLKTAWNWLLLGGEQWQGQLLLLPCWSWKGWWQHIMFLWVTIHFLDYAIAKEAAEPQYFTAAPCLLPILLLPVATCKLLASWFLTLSDLEFSAMFVRSQLSWKRWWDTIVKKWWILSSNYAMLLWDGYTENYKLICS